MYKCDICDFSTQNSSKFGGHIGSHVRKGEKQKYIRNINHECKICGCVCSSGQELGGHIKVHERIFEELKTSAAQRRALVRELGHHCQICSLNEWCGSPIPIELDHIDGNPENSTRENLRLICPNCHAQTSTYKGRNIGKVTNTKRQATLKKYYDKYR